MHLCIVPTMRQLIIFFSLAASLTCVQIEPRNVFDDAASALALYKTTVRDILNQISETFQDTYSHVQQTGQAISNLADRIIKRAQSDFMEQIRDLDVRVQAAGINPGVCIYGARLQLAQLPNSLRPQIDGCIDQITRESYYILVDAFASFDHLNDTVDEYANRIETCRNSDDEVCALVVITQISLSTDLLPVVLEGDVQEVVNQFGDMEPYFQTCSRGPTDYMLTRGRAIVDNAVRCVGLD